MIFKETLKIDKKIADEMSNLLSMEGINFHEMKLAEDSTLATFTARFENGFEADIKVCSGQHNCWVDPVLFRPNGSECSVGEPDFDLLGEYHFSDGENDYIVFVEAN